MANNYHTNWMSEADFLKAQSGFSIVGQPSLSINVDTDKQPTASQQTEGQLYSGNMVVKAAEMNPPLRCPNCKTIVHAISDAKSTQTMSVQESGGKSHEGDLLPCPVPGQLLDWARYTYVTSPCCCRVNVFWAGAFSAELDSRMRGQMPKPVVDMTDRERQARLEELEAVLTKLHKTNPSDTQQRNNVDRWKVVIADQIQRLCPGGHNKAPVTPEHLGDNFMAEIMQAYNSSDAMGIQAARQDAIKKKMFELAAAQEKSVKKYVIGVDHVQAQTSVPPPPTFQPNYEFKCVEITIPGAKRLSFHTHVEAAAYVNKAIVAGQISADNTTFDKLYAAFKQLPKKAQLQTFPVEQLNEDALLLAAMAPTLGTPAYKIGYQQGVKSIDKELVEELLGPDVTKPWLQLVVGYFTTQKQFMTTLVANEIVPGGDTISLMQTCASISQNIKDFINNKAKLTITSVRFLQAFKTIVSVASSDIAQGVSGPKPATEPPENVRGTKKRRTIRRIDEE